MGGSFCGIESVFEVALPPNNFLLALSWRMEAIPRIDVVISVVEGREMDLFRCTLFIYGVLCYPGAR